MIFGVCPRPLHKNAPGAIVAVRHRPRTSHAELIAISYQILIKTHPTPSTQTAFPLPAYALIIEVSILDPYEVIDEDGWSCSLGAERVTILVTDIVTAHNHYSVSIGSPP